MYKEKGSRFLAFAEVVRTEEEVRARLAYYRKTYHDARHVCYAYRLLNQPTRLNDDGEPSGTAGKPIQGRIESAGLENVLIVVVRYFGGILLGTGGLVVAYREASQDALAHTRIVEYEITSTETLSFPYERMHEIMKLIKDTHTRIISQEWEGSECHMQVEIKQRDKDRFETV